MNGSLRTIEKAQLDEIYVLPSTRMDETIRDHTRPQDAKKRTRTRWGFVLYALIGVFHYMTFENVKFDKNFTNFHRTLFRMVLNCAYASHITGNEEKNPIRKPFGVWPAENTIILYISLYDILKYQIR